VDGL
jgi:hypothetical protein